MNYIIVLTPDQWDMLSDVFEEAVQSCLSWEMPKEAAQYATLEKQIRDQVLNLPTQ